VASPGFHDFFVLRPAAFGDQFDPVAKYHGAADDGLIRVMDET
jgi:hypothetical protein